MTVSPHVELLFNPEELNNQAIQGLRALPTEAETVHGALERALLLQHIYMAAEMRQRIAEHKQIGPEAIYKIADYTWQAFAPKFVKISGPEIAVLYAQAMRDAKAGDVPATYINALAEEHARNLSQYFHNTSRDSMVQGFNTLVNRKVPQRAAADRVLSSYGLTARQMSGLTSNTTFDTKVNTSIFHETKQRLQDYIGKSVRQRIKLFADQEEHNLSQQAEQVAWMWKVEHGDATTRAEKIWITAKDEKTCKVCGPMHGHTALVSDQFEMPDKTKLWVPGPHPNCRCVVRFREPRRLALVQKDLYGHALADFNEEHPRGKAGRFSAKARTKEAEASPELDRVQELLAQVDKPEEEPPVEEKVGVDLTGVVLPSRTGVDLSHVDLAPRARGVNLAGIDLAPKESVGVDLTAPEAKPSLGVDLTAKPKAGVNLKSERAPANVNMAKDTVAVFEAQAKKMQDALDREAAWENQKYVKLPSAVYTMIYPNDEIDGNGNVLYGHHIEWTGDLFKAMSTAEEWRDAEILDVKENLSAGSPKITKKFERGSFAGMKLHAELDEEQTNELVDWVAGRGSSSDADAPWYEADEMDVEWTDGRDIWVPGKVSYAQAAEQLDLYPEQFDVSVATFVKGHDSTIYTSGPQTRSGKIEASTAGMYHVISAKTERIDHSMPIKFYELIPVDDPDELDDENE